MKFFMNKSFKITLMLKKKHIPTTNIFKKFLYFIFEFSKIKKESKLYIESKKRCRSDFL